MGGFGESGATDFVGQGDLVVNVEDYGAVGDGVTDDTVAIQTAVAVAIVEQVAVVFPGGDYLTSTTIADLHAAELFGQGRIIRGADSFYVSPRVGQANKLYVRSTGDNANDGLSAAQALREINAAVPLLDNYGPYLDGAWTIDVGAGTYKGGAAVTRLLGSRDFVKIVGPSVGGHPNVPTAVVDKAADTSKTTGVSATDGVLLWLENIKFTGAFANAVDVRRDVYLQWRNVHVTGAAVGLFLSSHCRYFVTGGIIENCTTNGINELFGVVRSFDTVTASSEQLIIRGCPVGLKAKEVCSGHIDFLNVEDCTVAGLELQAWSTANAGDASFKRNAIAVVLVNSEIHEDDGIAWGTGADLNTRRILSLGESSEIALFGWTSAGAAATVRTGHRPVVTLASDTGNVTVTNTTTETNFRSYSGILRPDWYTTKGKRFRITVWGTNNNLLVANYRVLFRAAGIFLADITLPLGLAAGAHFKAECEVVCSADGNNQRVLTSLLCDGNITDLTSIARTVDLVAGNGNIAVSGLPANVADSVTVNVVEIWG